MIVPLDFISVDTKISINEPITCWVKIVNYIIGTHGLSLINYFFLEIEEQRQPFILSGQDQSLMPLPIISSSTSRAEDIFSKTWGDQPKPKDLKPPNDR